MKTEGKCPKLLVTAYTGKAKAAIRELSDLIYIYDNQAEIFETRYRDVILVYTKADTGKIYNLIRRRTPTGVARVVKVQSCVEARPDRISEEAIKLFEGYRGSKFYVDCVRRGRAIRSSWELEKYVGAKILERGLGKVDFEDPDIVVKIEIIDSLALISIMDKYGDKVDNRKFRPPL